MSARIVRRGRGPLSAVVAAALTLTFATAATVGTGTSASALDCGAPRTLSANADSWLEQSSPSTNRGTDSILKIRSQAPDGNFRAVVRFPAPAAAPLGCVLATAVLRMYAASPDDGRTLQALRLASPWSEGSVSWANQPATAGAAVTTASGSDSGYREWKVTGLVKDGVSHGFLIRDSVEDDGGEQSFHAREKGENPPQLVLRYAPPPSPITLPPLPPLPATVTCGQVVTRSTLVMNNLSGCLGDGLVIGAPRIIIDLNGHTVDGIGLGAGVRNDGFATVTVRNGVLRDFDHGVHLNAGTAGALLERLTLELNQIAGIELFDADGPGGGNEIRFNTMEGNGFGIFLTNGTSGAVVVGNTVRENAKEGLALHDSRANRVEANRFVGGSDRAVELFASSDNLLRANTVTGSSDGGIDVVAGSHRNRLEANVLTATGDSGLTVSESDGNQLIANRAHEMSDNGISLASANDSVVRANDVRFNPTGLEISGSSRNLVTANDASESLGIGIEVGGGSNANRILLNIANATGGSGINLSDDALLADTLEPTVEHGNLVQRNVASGNMGDGIVAAKGGHTLSSNITRDNGGWGIHAQPGTRSDNLNVATGNGEPAQCFGVVCRNDALPPLDTEPPDTSITSGPDDNTEALTATFTFTGLDNQSAAAGLLFECRVDGTAFRVCASPASYSNLATGAHVFEVRAVDEAGNADPTPAADTWTITAPVVVDCGTPLTVPADADAWIDESSPNSNKGRDSVLKVRSERPRKNLRALVRFGISDDDAPVGCVVQSATLRLYAGGARTGRTLLATRVASNWTERNVTWSNQPAVAGPAAMTASGQRWREWTVTQQVQAMYDTANHGFLIRDAVEGNNGAEQSLHSREKSGDNPPQLVVRFAPATP